MDVCLVSQQYPPETASGGIGTQTWNKAHSLAALGHRVHVLTSSPSPELSRTAVRDEITIHRVPPPDSDPPVHTEPGYWLAYSWSVRRTLRELVDAYHYDVIDFAEYGAEGFAYQLGRSDDDCSPVVVQLHAPLALLAAKMGWPEPSTQLYETANLMEGVSIASADAVMACSANIADFVAEHYRLPREAIDVVHTGVDADAFHPDGDGIAPPNGPPTVLFVGNIAPNKGVVTTLEAVLALRQRMPEVRLEIVGRGSEGLLRQLKARVSEAAAEDFVRFRGFLGREELPATYRAAHVFCSVAEHEGGVANVYLEAMASGCPVVAGSEGGAPEAVNHGETGFIVTPGDVAATSDAIGAIIEDRALHRAMAQAGRRRVEGYFAMDKYILRVLDTYRRAAEAASQRRESRTGGGGGGGR